MALLAPRNNRSTRRGFSLIELMVVIVIIGILMGMLFVGINSAMSAARVASVNVEIQNLGKAIADFKLQYGVEPPSFIVLYEEAAEWTRAQPNEPSAISDPDERARLRNVSKATIRSIWPNYDFNPTRFDVVSNATVSNDVDINGENGATETFMLNGPECLAFFLGGVPRRLDVNLDGNIDSADGFQYGLYGFSADPTRPFQGTTGSRIGPFMEFVSQRVVDREGIAGSPDGMPELYDNMPSTTPGVTPPFQYFSSYDGAGYRPGGLLSSTADDEGTNSFPPYAQTITGGVVKYWKPNSFQIIAPGADGELGTGGGFNNGKFFDSSGERDASSERDNITNFKGGKLQ